MCKYFVASFQWLTNFCYYEDNEDNISIASYGTTTSKEYYDDKGYSSNLSGGDSPISEEPKEI